jgi:capsular exopolysaccharide synthesis family protein
VLLQDLIRFGRRWALIALALAVLATFLTYGLTKVAISKQYTASTTLSVQASSSGDPTAIDPYTNVQLALTEAQIATSNTNVSNAVKLARQVAGKSANNTVDGLSCTANGTTSLVNCTAISRSPVFAAALANSLATVFVKQQAATAKARFNSLLTHLKSQEQELLDQITKDRNTLRNSHGLDAQHVAALSSEIQQDQDRYNNLVQSETGVSQAIAEQAGIVTIVAKADVPTAPSSPHPTLNALIAFFLVILLVGSGAYLYERLDDVVRGEDELKSLVGVPILSFIPTIDALRDRVPTEDSIVVARNQRSTAAEAYRVTRTGIMFSRIDNPLRTLMVTSALQGEGKSTTSANLAVAFAETGKSVILVDLDLRRPSISKMFGNAKYGLTNLLLDDRLDPSLFTTQTSTPNLKVLATGPLPPNPAELISSRHMQRVIERLHEMADLVVVDSPPLLAVADAAVAATLCDAVLLVVRPELIKRRSLRRAMETLGSVGAQVIGVVLNSQPKNSTGYYYSYNSYGYADVEPAAATPNGQHQVAGEETVLGRIAGK